MRRTAKPKMDCARASSVATAGPSTAKKFLTPEEWDYWYEGKPAAVDIKDPYGIITWTTPEGGSGPNYSNI